MLLMKNWKIRVCFWFHYFYLICKISNFNTWTAKHLAQAFCTDLTLHNLNWRDGVSWGFVVCTSLLEDPGQHLLTVLMPILFNYLPWAGFSLLYLVIASNLNLWSIVGVVVPSGLSIMSSSGSVSATLCCTKECVNTLERLQDSCQWRPLSILLVATIGNNLATFPRC